MAVVRYVSDTAGCHVRETPGGTSKRLLHYGDLMYEIPGVRPQDEVLNGENYTWYKVHYYSLYEDSNDSAPYEGWAAVEELTTVISRTDQPTKPETYNSNSVLNLKQQLTNARYIWNFLIEAGFSSNAIYAMLGNMEVESYINPGKWQSAGNTNLGYGLTMWTPSTKLTDWASENGYVASDINTQLRRIEYEALNNLQWTSNGHSPSMTFVEFMDSTESVASLAEYFLKCYERPNVIINGSEAEKAAVIAKRQENALKWSTLIDYLL